MLGTVQHFELQVFEVWVVSSFSAVSGDLSLIFLFLFALQSISNIKSDNVSSEIANFHLQTISKHHNLMVSHQSDATIGAGNSSCLISFPGNLQRDFPSVHWCREALVLWSSLSPFTPIPVYSHFGVRLDFSMVQESVHHSQLFLFRCASISRL